MDLITLSQYEEKSHQEQPSGKGWINYGDDNLYPNYLVDLYQCSATHNALCTSIAYMIFGKGVQTDSLDARLKAEEWNLNDEIRKACLDLKIQGGFALEIIYSIDRTTISKVRHLPFENVRSGEVNDREEVDFYYYSRDWSDASQEPQEIRAFDPDDSKDFPTQIMYVKPFSIGSFYYPKPDYQGSISYIELDKEIGTYHINNIKNGLAPSFTIHFKNGTPAQEERTRIRTDIENQLAGATNAGKFIITYSDQPDRKPDFEPFPLSDADKQYQFLSTEVTDKIMVGHRVVSSAMFGVKTAGQLGNTQELAVASQLFDRQVIEPYQRIVNKALKSLFRAAGVPDVVVVSKSAPILIEASKDELESFSDYPDSVSNNAKRGIELNENNGNKCATQTGKVRAQQLAKGEAISVDTIKRMYSYLSRAEEYYDENDTKACGTISYLLWGGKAALGWSRNKLRELGELNLSEDECCDNKCCELEQKPEDCCEKPCCEKHNLSEEQIHELDLASDFLIDLGEEISDDYELIDCRKVDYDEEKSQDAMWSFARAIGGGRKASDPSEVSEQDNKLIKVRYAYMPKAVDTEVYKSRDFCRKMVGAGDKVWAKEQIELASTKAVNKGWGAGGAATYDLFLYKGGGSCAHYWERRTYLKKGNKQISVNRAKKIMREAGYEPLVKNSPKVAKRPRDMGNNTRGFLDGRGNWTTPQ